MTTDEAAEAGLLVAALRDMSELIEDAEREATGPIDTAGHTRWKALALKVWGKDHPGDDSQECVGEVLLPPTLAVHVLGMVKREIEIRLVQLGVEL